MAQHAHTPRRLRPPPSGAPASGWIEAQEADGEELSESKPEVIRSLITPLADGSSLLVGDERRRSGRDPDRRADRLRLGDRGHARPGDVRRIVAERAVPGAYRPHAADRPSPHGRRLEPEHPLSRTDDDLTSARAGPSIGCSIASRSSCRRTSRSVPTLPIDTAEAFGGSAASASKWRRRRPVIRRGPGRDRCGDRGCRGSARDLQRALSRERCRAFV